MAKRERMYRFEKPVRLTFIWIEKNQKRDPDNIIAGKKLVLDGLVNCGVLAGDGWKHITGCADMWTVVNEEYPNPGVIVEIEEEA